MSAAAVPRALHQWCFPRPLLVLPPVLVLALCGGSAAAAAPPGLDWHSASATAPGLAPPALADAGGSSLLAELSGFADGVRAAEAGLEAQDSAAVLSALSSVTLDVLTTGFRTARLLNEAYKNTTWALEHGSELLGIVLELKQSWASVRQVANAWENMTSAEEDTEKLKKPKDEFFEHPGAIQPLMAFVLLLAAFASIRKRRSFDLFSPMVYSRAQVSVAFTIVSLVALTVGNSYRINSFSDNPFALYVVQLVVCFFGVFCTLPIVVGVYQGSPKWLVVSSFVFVLWFLSIWLMSRASAMRFFLETGGDGRLPTNWATSVVITVLSIVLLGFSARHVTLHLCPYEPRFPPFFQVHAQACRQYVRERLKRGDDAVSAHLPAQLPVALCVCILGVGTFMAILYFTAIYWAVQNYSDLHDWVMDFVFPLQPLFSWAGYPLPLDDMNFAVKRSLICYMIALAVCALVTAWILCCVAMGYRRIFTQLARDQRYQGRAMVEQYGPTVFHATWATYFAGALMGNCVMAACIIGLLVFSLSMILSLAQFWAVLWTMRDWAILYGLLYVTRSIVFRWVVPVYVVDNGGSILRWRVWALLFPTLTLLNFIVGVTAGFVRSIVLMPFLLVRFFRVDITFLYEGLEDWDWSFQPFLSLVMHAHSRLNPVMWAVLEDLGGTVIREESFVHGAGAREEFLTPAASPCVDPGVADVSFCVEDGAPLPGSSSSVSMRTIRRNASGGLRRSLPAQRAVNRWHLAVLLSRNPSLAGCRAHQLRAAEAQDGSATDAVPPVLPPSFQPVPSNRARMAQLMRATTGGDL